MKKRKKSSNLDFSGNHHNIIYNNKINLNIYDEQYKGNTSYLNNNNIKMKESIGSSYLLGDINKKSDTILQKIKNKSKKRKKLFDINSKNTYKIKINYTTLNENNDITNNSNFNIDENKEIFKTKKRKKILLKKNFEDYYNDNPEKHNTYKDKIEIKSEKNININNNKDETKKYNLLKQIIRRRMKNNNHTNEIKSEENSKSSSNEDIYIYNGCDNFLIKEKYKKNVLNDIQNNDVNKNNDYKSNNYQQIKTNNNNSKKKLIVNTRKNKKFYVKVYKKKITNNSLSLSKNNKKEDNDIYSYNNNLYNSRKMKIDKFSTILNESNKKYFKINTFSNNKKPENNSKTSNKIKIKLYKKPNQRGLSNKIILYKSQKNINNDIYHFQILAPEKNTFYFHKVNKNQNKKIININDIQNNEEKNMEFKGKIKLNQNNLNSNNENDNMIIFNSNTYNPKIPINNKNFHVSNNDSFIQRKDINSMNILPNFYQNYEDLYIHIPILQNCYFKKENKIIISKNSNIKIENKNLEKKEINQKYKNEDKDKINNNNYIPIKSSEDNNGEDINQFVVSQSMIEKLNKIENNKNILISQNDNKKNTKESYSIDVKRTFKNNDIIKNIANNNFLYDLEKINNEKDKRYKIRSVVRIIKKNKNLNNSFKYEILNENNNIPKEERNEIIEKIKKEVAETKEEQDRHDKIVKILKEDIENCISFYDNKNNNEDINEKNKNYDLSIIEQLIIKVKVDLIDIINSFLLICNELIDNKNKLKICNKYINLFIAFYKKNYLNENNIKIIHIKLLKILYNIETLCVNNNYKYEIFGNIFYYFLNEQMFNENDLNYFDSDRDKFIIEIAKVVKFIIILSSNDIKVANERYFKFKNTKIFNKNPIYFNYVTKYLKSILNI